MGNFKKKQEAKLQRRRDAYDKMRNKDGFTRPGSQNPKKQSAGSARSGRR